MAKSADYRLGEFIFPRGWFMVADSEEVTDKPVACRYFGRDLVLYRGQSGRVVLLDAYCPHMKTHLGVNTTSYIVRDHKHIDGDSIRCPYHGWAFGPDGRCNNIPYATGAIPKAAKVKSWTVREAMGAIFMWHDPEDGEPEWELAVPPQWDDPQWVHWKIDHLGKIAQHPQELVDNIVDFGHFDPIHGSEVAYFENEFGGHRATQRQGGGHRTLIAAGAQFSTDTTYEGPGYLLSHLKGLYESIIFIAHTPVDDGVVKAWHGLLVKAPRNRPSSADVAAARAYQALSLAAFAQDFEVWSNKEPALNILQVQGDGPFHLERTWYKQFYNPRARRAEYQQRVAGVCVTLAKGAARPQAAGVAAP